MDKPKWSKEVALEIIQAGFLRMSKKYHPDVGGTHEQLLDLAATKEHLEKFVAGGGTQSDFRQADWTRAREEPRRPRDTYRTGTRSRYWNQSQDFTGEVPLEPYEADSDYVQLKDVTIMSVTEKAIRIKIPGVKQGQWLPKSQILFDDFFEFIDGEVMAVVFTKWIAKQKGWMK